MSSKLGPEMQVGGYVAKSSLTTFSFRIGKAIEKNL
jgi:hypothetical protein